MPPFLFHYNRISMALGIVFSIYCLEAGFFFLIAPWTKFWALNPLLHANQIVAAVAENDYVRGLVSGFGIVHLVVGVREILDLIRRRREARQLRRGSTILDRKDENH